MNNIKNTWNNTQEQLVFGSQICRLGSSSHKVVAFWKAFIKMLKPAHWEQWKSLPPLSKLAEMLIESRNHTFYFVWDSFERRGPRFPNSSRCRCHTNSCSPLHQGFQTIGPFPPQCCGSTWELIPWHQRTRSLSRVFLARRPKLYSHHLCATQTAVQDITTSSESMLVKVISLAFEGVSALIQEASLVPQKGRETS